MNPTHYIRAALDSVRTDLAETFPHLSDDLLDWAPAKGMRTIHGQFIELISTERSVTDRIKGTPRQDPDEADAPLWSTRTMAELLALLDETRADTLALLSSLGEDGLENEVEISSGFADYLGLHPATAGELLRFIVRHESYHAGQLVSYLWARGNDPYGWD